MGLTNEQCRQVIARATTALLNYCRSSDIHTLVTGVSGGLDSAVTVALAAHAVDIAKQHNYLLESVGLIMPCHSDPEHARLAKMVISQFHARQLEINLDQVFELAVPQIMKPIQLQLSSSPERFMVAQGNVKARLRMSLGTYYVANLTKGLVLSTDNYSEYWLGFWTLHGDVGDFGMIQELWKGDELIDLARYLQLPSEIIGAIPTDGLGVCAGGDEAQLGAPYRVIDRILQALLRQGIGQNDSFILDKLPHVQGVEPALVRRIAERVLNNSFKRRASHFLTRDDLGLSK